MTRVGILFDPNRMYESEEHTIRKACVEAGAEPVWLRMFGDDLDLDQVKRARLAFLIIQCRGYALEQVDDYVLDLAEKIVKRLRIETIIVKSGYGESSPTCPIEIIDLIDSEAAIKRIVWCITKGSYLVSNESISKMAEVVDGLHTALKIAQDIKEKHGKLFKSICENRKLAESLAEQEQ